MKRALPLSWHGLSLQLDLDGVLYWPEERLLVAADLHLEKGTSYASSAARLLPPYDSAQTVARLERLVEAYRPLRIIALGDSFHDRRGAARLNGEIAERIRALSDRADWIWIHGNHDPKPPRQLGGRGAVEIAIGPLVFRHDAHEEWRGAGGEVIGHYHPVASVSTRGRSFRRRCFAIGRHRLLLPAFGAYAGGLNVREVAIQRLLDARARVALLGRDRLHWFPLGATLPDPVHPAFDPVK